MRLALRSAPERLTSNRSPAGPPQPASSSASEQRARASHDHQLRARHVAQEARRRDHALEALDTVAQSAPVAWTAAAQAQMRQSGSSAAAARSSASVRANGSRSAAMTCVAARARASGPGPAARRSAPNVDQRRAPPRPPTRRRRAATAPCRGVRDHRTRGWRRARPPSCQSRIRARRRRLIEVELALDLAQHLGVERALGAHLLEHVALGVDHLRQQPPGAATSVWPSSSWSPSMRASRRSTREP